jgi:hypothetical protein
MQKAAPAQITREVLNIPSNLYETLQNLKKIYEENQADSVPANISWILLSALNGVRVWRNVRKGLC